MTDRHTTVDGFDTRPDESPADQLGTMMRNAIIKANRAGFLAGMRAAGGLDALDTLAEAQRQADDTAVSMWRQFYAVVSAEPEPNKCERAYDGELCGGKIMPSPVAQPGHRPYCAACGGAA